MRIKQTLLFVLLLTTIAQAAPSEAERKLPEPLVCQDGTPVKDAKTWQEKRRGELLELFTTEVYGRAPLGKPKDLAFNVVKVDNNAFGGKVIRKDIEVFFTKSRDPKVPHLNLLLFLPKSAEKKPVPVFVCMNFKGNDAVLGAAKSRWPIEMLTEAGYGVATFARDDIDPDKYDEFKNGVHGLFDAKGKKRAPDAWGTITAWAWGISRAADYLETDKMVDAKHLAVVGHSRLGKTALWVGANDPRFGIVVSNNSGCGGAAVFRGKIGERIARINDHFPHWFCDNFDKYDNAEDKLPVDQHELVALIAPRPVYIASASEDLWADPVSEFLAAKNAAPVYALLTGKKVAEIFPATKIPEVNSPIAGGLVGYHVREGKHNITDYDWSQYIKFANKHWSR